MRRRGGRLPSGSSVFGPHPVVQVATRAPTGAFIEVFSGVEDDGFSAVDEHSDGKVL